MRSAVARVREVVVDEEWVELWEGRLRRLTGSSEDRVQALIVHLAHARRQWPETFDRLPPC
jgi:hypothetical protein